MTTVEKKLCRKCQRRLPISEFRSFKHHRPDGTTRVYYGSPCKDCINARRRMLQRDKTSNYYKHQQEASKKSYSYVKARRARDPEYDAYIRERDRLRAKARRERLKQEKSQ